MEQLFRSMQKRIYDFLYKYTQNPETAMDLLQDTFLSFFKSYGDANLPEEQSIMLLYRIARNRSINFAKKFSTKNESQASEIFVVPDVRNFAKELETKDLENKLLECLDDLDPNEKEAIILKYVEGLNQSQIASILDVSISTVSRTITKATAKLLVMAREKEISLQ
ncbi:MAG: sigma-70 family RNA polymerase sigma factor [Leptospira sp.]|nr:sigma-70 family RNA polymerase sigma factor [Leptospira sp.]